MFSHQSDQKSIHSLFFYSKTITEENILQAIYMGKFYGIVMIDLDTPDVLKKSFQKLNVGTIFSKICVDEEMVLPKMKKICSDNGVKFPHRIE